MEKARSYLYFISSMLIFGTIGIFRRYIPLSSSLLSMCRGFLGSLFLLVGFKRNIIEAFKDKRMYLVGVSGMLIGVNWMLLFEAYNYTSVAKATLAYYMEPTIVVLCSPLIFKEKLGFKKLMLALLALFGMVLISGVFEASFSTATDFKGIAYGLGAALLYSMVVMFNKKLGDVDASNKTIVQLFFAGLVMVPYVMLTGVKIDGSITPFVILMVLIVGIIHTGLAYSLYFKAMEGLKAQSIAILSYIDPVASLILSFLVLRENLDLFGLIGAALIIGSAIVSELSESR